MNWLKRLMLMVVAGSIAVAGCGDGGGAGDEDGSADAEIASGPTRALPTLYPTPTYWPTAAPTETRPPQPAEPTDTPIAFDQVVVELRYWIPDLPLDRRLTGNVASHIEVVDAASGESVIRRNQPGILLQLQRVLPELTLEDAPAGCELCVYLEYRLPLENQDGAGWLTDVQMLASIENFTAATLGPFFPPGSIFGLRRSATPYFPAHTVALTADGQLWRWVAIEPRISPAENSEELGDTLRSLAAAVDPISLPTSYRATCPEGSGIDHLLLPAVSAEGPLEIICAELALPGDLAALYQSLAELADETVAEFTVPAPPDVVSLDSLLFYQQGEGARLNFYEDNTLRLILTDTLTVTAAITPSVVTSVTATLLDSEALTAETDPFAELPEGNLLFVRGDDNVAALAWEESVPEAIAAVVQQLDDLIAALLAAAETDAQESSLEVTRVPAPTATP